MNFIELTTFDNNKVIVNFNFVSKLQDTGIKSTYLIVDSRLIEVKESIKEIEKLLNELSHFIKRAYKPEL